MTRSDIHRLCCIYQVLGGKRAFVQADPSERKKKKRLWEDDECAWRRAKVACGRWTSPVGFQVSLNLMRHLKFQLKTKNKAWHHSNPM